MQRSAFAGAFVFVEGISDERFYSLFLDSSACKIIICHGRPQVFATCNILESSHFAAFFGIADADFDHANSIPSPLPSVFLTDWHDAECFMLKSSAFDRIIHEHADRTKLAQWSSNRGITKIISHLVEETSGIGHLLWHSLQQNLALNFKGLRLDKFVSTDNLTIDVSALVQQVLTLSGSPSIEPSSLLSGIDERRRFGADYWQIVRGHDLVDLICLALRSVWRSEGPLLSSDVMEGILRTAYPVGEFASTSLCAQIRSWEETNERRILLSCFHS